MARFEARITFCGQPAKVACDGKCSKAWGMNSRPKVRLSGDPDDFDYDTDPDGWQRAADDYAYLADGELGEAPECPGTWEGSDGKPVGATGPKDFNKWCIRECERNVMSHLGEHDRPLPLPDFSRRVYNMPSLHPEAARG